jgi:hypothetical protein
MRTVSSTEILEPNRAAPKIDASEPNRLKFLNDILDPQFKKLSTDMLEPAVNRPKMETALPIRAKLRIEIEEPKWRKFKTETLEPRRAKLRKLIELPTPK